MQTLIIILLSILIFAFVITFIMICVVMHRVKKLETQRIEMMRGQSLHNTYIMKMMYWKSLDTEQYELSKTLKDILESAGETVDRL